MNKKQAREAIILAVLLLALLIAVVIQFTGGKKSATGPDSPAAQNTAAAPAETAASAPAPAADPKKDTDLSWINTRRLEDMSVAVARGRDPFEDIMAPPPVAPAPPQPTPSGTSKVVGSGSQGSLVSGMLPGGPLPLIKPTIVPPVVVPPPAFTLWGVAISSRARFATISLGEHYFTLAEGEMVPGVGWTVERIIPDYNAVVLTKKGAQSVTLRMSGGSPK